MTVRARQKIRSKDTDTEKEERNAQTEVANPSNAIRPGSLEL